MNILQVDKWKYYNKSKLFINKSFIVFTVAGLAAMCGVTGCSDSVGVSTSEKQEADLLSNKKDKSEKGDIKNKQGDIKNGEGRDETGSSINLFLGEAFSLNDKLHIEEPDMASVKIKSSDENIVAVGGGNYIHALKAGSAVVTVEGEGIDLEYNVKVKKRGMVYPVFSMMKGEKFKLQFSNGAENVKWKSSDSKVAIVSKSGNVTAKAVGSAILTGIADKCTYVCDLRVTKKIKSVIYLTFDDGPSRYSTPKILDILKKNDVKATFFELRPAGTDFDLTERVINEGHTLALHGFQHKYDKVYRSEKVYRENLDKLRNMFFRRFGVWCTISRFPGGSSNTVSSYNKGIMTRLTKKLDSWGYTYFDWNVSSSDAGGAKNPKQVYSSVVGGLRKGHSNVVLMHDFTNNDKTINALQKIIKYGKKHGYTFLPLSASTVPVHHGVSN